jgi:hypothetical protein
MTFAAMISLAQTLAIVGVGIMEAMLIRELRETRKFLQSMNDNVMGAVGASMALNTAIAAVAAFFKNRGTQND